MTASAVSSSKKPQAGQFSNQLGQANNQNTSADKAELQKEYQDLLSEKDTKVRGNDNSGSDKNDNTNTVTNEKGNNEDENKASLQSRADLVKVQLQFLEGQETQNQNATDSKNRIQN